MKKVCISTFCVWSSFGSMLQSYGLQYALRELGCEGFVVIPGSEPEARWNIPGFQWRGIKRLAVELHTLLIAGRIRKRYREANQFIQSNILVKYAGSYEALRNHPPKADAYLTGSDQVWNPRKLDPSFFLDYVPEGFPRISYAASMGITKIPNENQEAFGKYVNEFTHISLREKDNVEVVRAYTDRPAEVHLDPVFLVPREHWKSMEKPYPIDEPYILVYPIFWRKDLNQELKRLHEKTGKTVVALQGQAQRVYANKRIFDASPEQFLWLIDHADAVVSSSFHGIAMSIVFQKPFAAVIDPKSPSRLNNLLDTFGVENTPVASLCDMHSNDYSQVEQRTASGRDRSMDYLRKVLCLNE